MAAWRRPGGNGAPQPLLHLACRYGSLAGALVALLLPVSARPAFADGPPLPPLRTVQQVHDLPAAEAERGYPVELDRAQVLYLDSSAGMVFLKDSSGDRVARAKAGPAANLRPGDMVGISGITDIAGESVLIDHVRLRLLGHGPLPGAPAANPHALFSGDYDMRWVSIEGILKSATPTGEKTRDAANVLMTVFSGWDQLEVATRLSGEGEARGLIDARVRLRAIVSNQFNNRDLLVSVRLFMPDLSCVEILERPPADPFALPLTGIGALTAAGFQKFGHRVHIRGVITSAWDQQHVSVMDAENGVFVTTDEPIQAGRGDLVDVAGFPSLGDYTTILDHALLRRIGSAVIPAPVHVTAAQAMSGTHDAEPIEVDGRLLSHNFGDGVHTLLLADGRTPFAVVLPGAVEWRAADRFSLGSLLRVRGVCVVQAGSDHVPKDFLVLLRSPADVVVLDSPSWWTPGRVLMLAGLLLALVLAAIFWNALLRRRVRDQTSMISSQLENAGRLRLEAEAAHQETSHALYSLQATQQELLAAQEKLRYQATHDSLTGLWNRAAIMDALHNEIERAGRTATPLGVLLLDLDHFKQVNDTYGHLVGDATLKEIAHRIAGALRPYDIAGRYGGEEFLILLPACGNLETRNVAERVRSAIAAAPFSAGQDEFCLTISIGATIALDRLSYESHFLKQADDALYQAKAQGRNRTILHGEPSGAPETASSTLFKAQ